MKIFEKEKWYSFYENEKRFERILFSLFSSFSLCYTNENVKMINPEMILLLDVCYEDYILILNKIRATVNEKDLEK